MISSYTNKTPMENLETELILRKYSKETIKSYLYYNKLFLKFVQKSPKYVFERDIKYFIKSLIDLGLEENTINLAISSIMFYYTKIMHRKFKISRLKKAKRLYPVLSKDEIISLFNAAKNPKHKLLFETLYSTGLRVSEIARLKISDIDLNRNIGYVKRGKGNKDRLFTLSTRLVQSLGTYLDSHGSEYIFSTEKGYYSNRSIQKLCKKYSKLAGINKRVTPHTFRRSFATHLIEDGIDIFTVQKLLGHQNISTTQEYIKLSKVPIEKITNPLDKLYSTQIGRQNL